MESYALVSRRFWTDTLERVIRTTAQAAVAVLATPIALAQTGVAVDFPWQAALTSIIGTAVLTFLTCLAGRTAGDTSTASLTSGTSGPSMQGTPGQVAMGDTYEGRHRG